MKKRDKNKIILLISAALIIISLIITIVAFIYEKNLSDKNDVTAETTKPSVTDEIKNEPQNSTSETPDTTIPESTTLKPTVDANNKPGTYKVVTQNSPLGIRTKPLQGASQSGNVAKGSEVTVLATYNGWAFFNENGKFGWLSLTYLELVTEGTTPTNAAGKYKIATQNDPLNIREKPESNTAVKGRIPKDTVVDVLVFAGDWGYVEYNGNSGWIPSQYLEKTV